MISKFWVLETFIKTVYILDEGYNVWDFDIDSVGLLSNFIDIIGVSQDGISPAVIKYNKSKWSAYVQSSLTGDTKFRASLLSFWESHGYLYDSDLRIYTPNILVARGLKCLLSESGDLLRVDMEPGTGLDLASISHRLVGFIYGHDFNIVISEDVTILNYYFLWYTHRVNVIMDFHGHDEAYDTVYNKLYLITKMLSTVHIVRRKS